MQLSSHLDRLDAAGLARLCAERAVPGRAPAEQPRATLAAALQTDRSVGIALTLVDAFELQVLSVVTALAPTTTGEVLAAVAQSPGPPVGRRAGAADVTTGLARLAELALVWADDEGALFHPPPLVPALSVLNGVGPSVLTLTPQALNAAARAWGVKGAANVAAAIGDRARVDAYVRTLPGASRDLLAAAAEKPVQAYPWSLAARDLVTRGLLLPLAEDVVVAARELRDRSERLSGLPPLLPEPPPATGRPITAAELAARGGQALDGLRAAAVQLVAGADRDGIPTLKDGTVGVRDQRRLGKELGWQQEDVRWLLGVLADAGLVGATWGAPVRASDAGVAFLAADPVDQWLVLLAASLTSAVPRWYEEAAELPGHHGVSPTWRTVRPLLLRALADQPGGLRRTTDEVLDLLAWYRPVQDVAAGVPGLAELELAGLVYEGCLTPLGEAVRAGDDPTPVLAALAPALERTARFQADLTATVLGTPSGALVRTLDGVAVRESRGPATVWRLTPAGVRGRMDSGATAAGITEELAAVSAGPLPDAVARLVADVARTHGQVKVGTAGTVVLLADTAAVELLLRTRGLARLGLARLGADTVTATASPAVTLTALRKAGFAPVPLAGGPAVAVRRPKQRSRPDTDHLETVRTWYADHSAGGAATAFPRGVPMEEFLRSLEDDEYFFDEDD